MKSWIKFWPLFVGLLAGYMVGLSVIHADKLLKFIIISIYVGCFGYLMTWMNIKLMKKEVDALSYQVLESRKNDERSGYKAVYFIVGHTLTIIAAIAVGYGFSLTNHFVMITGLVVWWIADESLIKASRIQYLSQKQREHSAQQNGASSPSVSAIVRAIEERRKEDPLIGAKIGAIEVYHHILALLKNEKGVHVESLLCALGAVAGYSCQASIRAQAEALEKPETSVFMIATAKDGRKYYFGDLLNGPLAEDKLSIWSLAAASAQENGRKISLDVAEIFKHSAESVGREDFGVPRVPESHRAGDIPVNYVKAVWPVVMPIARAFCKSPVEWPVLFGLAIQHAMKESKGVLSADTAIQIIMESAVPSSKFDLVAVQ